MKQYRITEVELNFLKEMIKYLNIEGNSMSDEGSQTVKEMFSNVASRPVVDIVIDPKVFDGYEDVNVEELIANNKH